MRTFCLSTWGSLTLAPIIIHVFYILSIASTINLHSGSNKAIDVCYNRANIRGDEFGNCGHSTTNYLACSMRYDLAISVLMFMLSLSLTVMFSVGSCSVWPVI